MNQQTPTSSSAPKTKNPRAPYRTRDLQTRRRVHLATHADARSPSPPDIRCVVRAPEDLRTSISEGSDQSLYRITPLDHHLQQHPSFPRLTDDCEILRPSTRVLLRKAISIQDITHFQ